MWATSVIFNKMLEVKTCPIGENSPNPVTLLGMFLGASSALLLTTKQFAHTHSLKTTNYGNNHQILGKEKNSILDISGNGKEMFAQNTKTIKREQWPSPRQ
jgi:hypothetical protein